MFRLPAVRFLAISAVLIPSLALASPAPPPCSAPTFTQFPGSPLPEGFTYQSTTIADVNNDGHADLVIGNNNTDQVDIFYGDGHGGVSAPIHISFPNLYHNGSSFNPTTPKVVDLNGDGLPDVIVDFPNIDQIGVALAQSGGGFAPATSYFMQIGNAVGPRTLAVGDLNGDGYPDVVTANSINADGIVVRLNDGHGAFGGSSGVNLNFAHEPFEIALADVNGDGRLDVVAHDTDPAGVIVLLGNGDGTLQAPIFSSVFVSFSTQSGFALADFNGDGKVDVAIGDGSGPIHVRFGDGTGHFSGGIDLPGSSFQFDLAAGDINGDGFADIVAGPVADQAVKVFLGDGAGHFAPAVSTSIGNQVTSFGLGDLDGDGRPDILAGFEDQFGNNTGIALLQTGCAPNAPPTVTPAAISASVGSSGSTQTIASVSDDSTPAGSIGVAVSSVDPTLVVSALTNTNGSVSAQVGATCAATPGTSHFILQATDADGLSTNAPLSVNVTPNTAPAIGAYAALTVHQGDTTTIAPASAPSDNGFVNSLSASAGQSFTGSFSFDTTTGALTVNNAGPVGIYTVTVTAADNCGATTTTTFTLTVRGTATLALSNLSAVYDGSAHFATVTTQPAGLSYTVEYSQNGSPIAAPINAGSYDVTAALTNEPLYDSTPAHGTLTIAQAHVVLAWPSPAPIPYGTPLGALQLDPVANIPGTFAFAPPAGTLLLPGVQLLTAIFTPADSTDFAGGQITTTIAVLSQSQTKQQLLAELEALASGVTDRETRHKLDDAANRVAESLAPVLWAADGIHLEPRHGRRVFDLEKQAVTKLREVTNDRRSSVPAEALQGLIAGFVAVDRQLAVTAIAGRTTGVGDAQRDLAEGDASASAGRGDHAIEQYAQAWEDAVGPHGGGDR